MLDDLTLEELLGDAAREIVVPGDGPERVLAARGAVPQVRRRPAGPFALARRRPVPTVAVALASLALVGVVAGVASGGGGPHVTSASRPSSSEGAGGHPVPGPLLAVPAVGAAGGGSVSQSETASGTAQGAPDLVPGSTQAKVIKNGSMTLRVTSVESTVDQLQSLALSAGGYLASSTLNVPGGAQAPDADVTARVPEAAFESFTSQVEALGRTSQVAISGQDVTSQYADLSARLKALESTISQLELIETRAQTIGDVLAVEQQISDQQTQADQIQGQINVLNDETSYGSLTVHVVQPNGKAAAAPTPPGGISKAWEHARRSFAHGFEAVVGALGGIAVFLLFAGVLLGIAWFGWTAVRRRLV